jgi:hypothetical protein
VIIAYVVEQFGTVVSRVTASTRYVVNFGDASSMVEEESREYRVDRAVANLRSMSTDKDSKCMGERWENDGQDPTTCVTMRFSTAYTCQAVLPKESVQAIPTLLNYHFVCLLLYSGGTKPDELLAIPEEQRYTARTLWLDAVHCTS